MKRFSLTILSLVLAMSAFPQEKDGRVSFFPVVNNQSDIMPKAIAELLESKMHQAIASSGYGSAKMADRFVVVAKPAVISKDVAPTTPPRINQQVEITFIVGDVIENKVYASCSSDFSGIGMTEIKAWQSALTQLKPTDTVIKRMFAEAYSKIEAYYSTNCKSMMAKAESLAARGQFDEAISLMVNIPDVCHDCFASAQHKAVELYQQKIDSEGAVLLSKAKSEWAAAQNSDGANIALGYLSQINSNSSLYSEKEILLQTIASKLSSDEQRRIEEEQKRYNDELYLRQTEQNQSHKRQMAVIAACRSVAEKWAENQPPQYTVYLNW